MPILTRHADQIFRYSDVPGAHHIPSFARDFSRGFFLPLITLAQVYAGAWPPLHWSDADGLLIHMHVPHRKVTVDFWRLDFFLIVDPLKYRDA
jgi:hypothetical protein